MSETELICCTPKRLPDELIEPAAAQATLIRPENHPLIGADEGPLQRSLFVPGPVSRIAFLTTKYWGLGGVRLTVGFLDGAPLDLQTRIIDHMNAWGKIANIKFMASKTSPQVRIARTPGSGYWSYLGTDILQVASDEQTMNLDSFTMNTSDSEFYRVVRHETGHVLGCPHEHMRAELVANINPQAAYRYFGATQGWSRQEVKQQVLTPLDPEDFLIQSPTAESDSIMCYQLPGSIMKDGKPVVGGKDITADDYAYASLIYPISEA